MKIKQAIFSPGMTGFFFDDQRAIKKGAIHDGFTYEGEPVTDGFTAVRQAGNSISILLLLEDGRVAVGDACAVQYSGAGGRDPVFLAETYLPFLQQHIAPKLQDLEITSFRSMTTIFDEMQVHGKRLHTAVRYGLSQALLDACALAANKTKTEVVCDEYQLPLLLQPIPLFGQTGDDRYDGVDKMIIKEVDVLPHALINNIDEKLGRHGEKLQIYVKWLADRIRSKRIDTNYEPSLHIDVYGNIGAIFDNNVKKMADYLVSLEEAAQPFKLHIEGPMDMEAKAPQIEMLAKLKDRLTALGTGIELVADEWCNTLEDIRDFCDAQCCHMVQIKTPDLGSVHNIVESILYCKENGMESYQGGTCNETDVSARSCVHVALAARPERMLAKPGMGFDEGFMIVKNEMERTLALLRHKQERSA